MSAPVSFIEWRWSKDCSLKSIAHACSVYDIALSVYERFRVDGLKRFVNEDRLRVDRDKNMRLLAFAFTFVFVWTRPKACDEFVSMWAGRVSASLRLIFGFSFNVFGALALDLTFWGENLKLVKYYIQYSFRKWCYFNALSVALSKTDGIVYHSSVRCVVGPALDVIRAQLQRCDEGLRLETSAF